MQKSLITLWLFTLTLGQHNPDNACTISDFFHDAYHCHPIDEPPSKRIYIMYDINPSEGFNLRRDVYIRLAAFIRHLRNQDGFNEVKLVLPPFQRLYHWRSYMAEGDRIFWNHFFDLDSLRRYTAVLDIWEYFAEINRGYGGKYKRPVIVHELIRLQNFKDMFENGQFVEKFELDGTEAFRKISTHFGYANITIRDQRIVRYQGSVMLLQSLLNEIQSSHSKRKYENYFTFLILNAEVVLHHFWGDSQFWQARRSMRFSRPLIDVANRYRWFTFNSTDEADGVQRPQDWRNEKPHRSAAGGNYICAHLRRADFLHGREKTTPSLQSAAKQISKILNSLDLEMAFISSDCTGQEYRQLRYYLPRHKIRRFQPETEVERSALRDGGVAIVDQIICSHARYFIGTFESTFTFRIYEEREILGFPQNSTFNTFCKYEDATDCPKNSAWPIVY